MHPLWYIDYPKLREESMKSDTFQFAGWIAVAIDSEITEVRLKSSELSSKCELVLMPRKDVEKAHGFKATAVGFKGELSRSLVEDKKYFLLEFTNNQKQFEIVIPVTDSYFDEKEAKLEKFLSLIHI